MAAAKWAALAAAFARLDAMRHLEITQLLSSSGGLPSSEVLLSREEWRAQRQQALLSELQALIPSYQDRTSMPSSSAQNPLVIEEMRASIAGVSRDSLQRNRHRVVASEVIDTFVRQNESLLCSIDASGAARLFTEAVCSAMEKIRPTTKPRSILRDAIKEWDCLFYIYMRCDSVARLPLHVKKYFAVRREAWRNAMDQHHGGTSEMSSLPVPPVATKPSYWVVAGMAWKEPRRQWLSLQQAPNKRELTLIRRLQRRLRRCVKQKAWRQRSFRSLASTYRAQLPTQREYLRTTRFVEEEEGRLELLENAEENSFFQQWKKWDSQMTAFYMHVCSLDPDWVERQDPATPSKKFYVNLRTGKSQAENPNALKVVAARTRQWAKAAKQRDERRATMKQHAEELRCIRALKISKLEGALSQSPNLE